MKSLASILKNPFVHVWNLLTWLFARMILFTTQLYDLPVILAQEEEEADFMKPPKLVPKRFVRPCDMKMTLYIINETSFNRGFSSDPEDCSLPFYAQRVSTQTKK